jgi:hypothetical protein
MIDVAKTTETVNRLFDAFDEACSKPGISLLDTFFAAHVFLHGLSMQRAAASNGLRRRVRDDRPHAARPALTDAAGLPIDGSIPPFLRRDDQKSGRCDD